MHGEEVHLCCHLGELVWLGVDPSKGLHVCQVVVLWQIGGQVDDLVVAPLRWHDDRPDLLDLHHVVKLRLEHCTLIAESSEKAGMQVVFRSNPAIILITTSDC